MELNSVADEPGATLTGRAIAYSECDANSDSRELVLPSGVVKNYDELHRAFERSFEIDNLYGIENSPILTMHVCFAKDFTDRNDELKPFVCAIATGEM